MRIDLLALAFRFVPLTVLMSGHVVKEVANGAKKISIILAEEVQDRGYKRVIDAIDPAIIQQTVEKVANAFSGSKMMTTSQKARPSRQDNYHV